MWWWVVWAEFELGCTGQKEVGGQEAGGRSWRAWESWGARAGEESNVAGGANSHEQRQTFGRPFIRWFLAPRVATALGLVPGMNGRIM